ncbi:MAG: glyceraldehyde 3-phosphate dehydrogenase NAD-binding domain-containing protein, partial [Porticoccaceae bacterium]|nr:glyceraldehyde 3-phosphate dehydrogenase NAD-binding domain-containing protein [Porticoccaceae bacterium]
MPIRVGINGFGRIGRMAMRAAWGSDILQIVHINEIAGDAVSAAHLLKFDSIHGTWIHDVSASKADDAIIIDNVSVSYSQCESIQNQAWIDKNIDLVIDCSGKFKSARALSDYFSQGIKRV